MTTTKKNTVSVECPACSCKKAEVVSGRVYRCTKCEAIHGSCYLGDSYTHVLPWMAKDPIPAENERYFDLECLGSAGLTRRHGWYDPSTKLIHQVG